MRPRQNKVWLVLHPRRAAAEPPPGEEAIELEDGTAIQLEDGSALLPE